MQGSVQGLFPVFIDPGRRKAVLPSYSLSSAPEAPYGLSRDTSQIPANNLTAMLTKTVKENSGSLVTGAATIVVDGVLQESAPDHIATLDSQADTDDMDEDLDAVIAESAAKAARRAAGVATRDPTGSSFTVEPKGPRSGRRLQGVWPSTTSTTLHGERRGNETLLPHEEKADASQRDPRFTPAEMPKFSGHHLTIGGLADSAYEYMLKQYILDGKKDEVLLQMYVDAMQVSPPPADDLAGFLRERAPVARVCCPAAAVWAGQWWDSEVVLLGYCRILTSLSPHLCSMVLFQSPIGIHILEFEACCKSCASSLCTQSHAGIYLQHACSPCREHATCYWKRRLQVRAPQTIAFELSRVIAARCCVRWHVRCACGALRVRLSETTRFRVLC